MSAAEIAAWASGLTVVIGAIGTVAVRVVRAAVGRLGSNLGPRVQHVENLTYELKGRLDELRHRKPPRPPARSPRQNRRAGRRAR